MFSGLFLLCWLAFVALIIASLWVVFTKANKPGWAAIVPVYNLIVMLEIIGRPLWWIVLYFIPLVNLIVGILTSIDVAKSFGKGVGTGIGLAFLPIIFYPLLAFGDASYKGPAARTATV